jgi:hypothetical protein
LDDYIRNVKLCDLTAQPDEIKAIIAQTIAENAVPKEIPQVGIRLMKFCGTYDLIKVTEQIQSYADPLNARYTV